MMVTTWILLTIVSAKNENVPVKICDSFAKGQNRSACVKGSHSATLLRIAAKPEC